MNAKQVFRALLLLMLSAAGNEVLAKGLTRSSASEKPEAMLHIFSGRRNPIVELGQEEKKILEIVASLPNNPEFREKTARKYQLGYSGYTLGQFSSEDGKSFTLIRVYRENVEVAVYKNSGAPSDALQEPTMISFKRDSERVLERTLLELMEAKKVNVPIELRESIITGADKKR